MKSNNKIRLKLALEIVGCGIIRVGEGGSSRKRGTRKRKEKMNK
jgi:hypothetical protein